MNRRYIFISIVCNKIFLYLKMYLCIFFNCQYQIQCCSRGTDHLRDPENKGRQFGQNLRTRLYRSPARFVYGFFVVRSITVRNKEINNGNSIFSACRAIVANGNRLSYAKTVNKSSWRSIKSSSQILTKLTGLVLWVPKVVSSP